MTDPDPISRRELLALGAAVIGASALPRPLARLAQQRGLARTEDQVLGPFYPVEKPLDRDADLTLVRNRRGAAQGQVIHLGGRVVDVNGRPLPGIKVAPVGLDRNGTGLPSESDGVL